MPLKTCLGAKEIPFLNFYSHNLVKSRFLEKPVKLRFKPVKTILNVDFCLIVNMVIIWFIEVLWGYSATINNMFPRDAVIISTKFFVGNWYFHWVLKKNDQLGSTIPENHRFFARQLSFQCWNQWIENCI